MRVGSGRPPRAPRKYIPVSERGSPFCGVGKGGQETVRDFTSSAPPVQASKAGLPTYPRKLFSSRDVLGGRGFLEVFR